MIDYCQLIAAAREKRGTFFELDNVEFAYVGPDSNGVITVGINGTTEWADLRWSLRTEKVWWPFADRGFMTQGSVQLGTLASCCEVLESILKNHKVRFVGHSVGGNAAQALALAWQDLGKGEVEGVVTFGAPAVFSKGFKWPNIAMTRYVCGNDPIPVLWAPFWKHTHSATKIPSVNKCMSFILDHKLSSYERSLLK